MAKKQAQTSNEPWESAHRIWLAGLGALSAAGEEGEKLFRTLVDRGENLEKRVSAPAKKVRRKVADTRSRAGRAFEGIESAFDDRVTAILGRLGVPTRAEIAALGRKVDRLTRVVGGTEASSSKKRKTTKRKTTKTGAKTTRAKKAVRKTKAKPARGRTS